MKIYKKTLLLLLLVIIMTIVTVSSVSAANYYVNNNTSTKDISNWIKDDAKNGDSLIFNTETYELTDKLTINKDIIIKSDKRTKINFNTNDHMFNITSKKITIKDISINYNAEGKSDEYCSMIVSSGSVNLNLNNVNININKKNSAVIAINKCYGNITNSNIHINTNESMGIYSTKWTGNIINSKIVSKSMSCFITLTWNGKIYNSEIYSYGKFPPEEDKAAMFASFVTINSKGSISNSIIKSKYYYSVAVTDNVKVSNCILSSKKGLTKIYRCRPDLYLDEVTKQGNTYYLKIYNYGELSSKPCYAAIKVGKNVYKKYTKSLKSEKHTTVKITLPAKYANSKYSKIAKIDFYNKIKENLKSNNVIKFKF